MTTQCGPRPTNQGSVGSHKACWRTSAGVGRRTCCRRSEQLLEHHWAALLGQSKHVTDGVGDDAQRAAVCGRQRLGKLGGEIAGRQGHRSTQNLHRICDAQRREAIRHSLPAGLVEECRDGEHDEDHRQTDDRDGVSVHCHVCGIARRFTRSPRRRAARVRSAMSRRSPWRW